MTMCRSTDHRIIRIVKRWLRRRTGSIPTEEAPTLRQATATSRRHRIRHCDDDEYSTPRSASSVYDVMHNDYSSLHHADAVGEQDQFCSSSATTQVSRQPQCFECDCSAQSVPPSFSTRRRRMMCDDDGREKVPQPASSVVEALDGRQEVSLSSHDFSSDPSIGRSTTSLMSSSSSSSSSSMVTCCFCRRWRHHSRHHQTGGKRPTELDVDDEYGRLTADTFVRHSSSLTTEASYIVPCRLQVEATGRSQNRMSPRRVPSTPIVPPSSSSTRHSCHGNNNVGDDLVCGCTSATKCMKNSFDATVPSATEIYDYVHLPTMSPSHRRTTRSCNTRSGGERVRQQLHAYQDYPPSIAISADGEESPFGRPLVSVMRPDRRDCNGPPPNRVAPFS